MRDDYIVGTAKLNGYPVATGHARYVGPDYPDLLDEMVMWARDTHGDCIIQADNTGLQRFSHGWWLVPWEDLTDVREYD